MKEIAHITDPAGPSSSPLSPATSVGDLVFCSGQVAYRPGTAQLVDGGIEAQTRQVLENLGRVLQSAGTSLEQVVKTLVFLGDPGDFASFNQVYAQFFQEGRFPARSTVQAGFAVPGVLVEIECVAVRPAVADSEAQLAKG